jgi:hypothetical protein
MRENQLPVHYTSAEETGRVRPAVDSGNGGEHIARERVTHVEAIRARNYLADDLSSSVQITVAHFSAAGSASAPSDVSVAPLTKLDEARDSELGKWLLVSAVISVTTLFTALYSICDRDWVPNLVAQLSAEVKRTASTSLGGTAVTATAKVGAGPVARAAGVHAAPSAVQPKGETGNHTVSSNAGESGAGGGMLPDLSLQSKAITNNPMDSMNQGTSFPVAEMPKAAEGKTSKSKKGLMVPPPPPTPCVLPPGFGFLPVQPTEQDAADQQQLQQAQASHNTHDQNTTPTAASGKTEAQSAALDAADKELQAAVNSSLRTVGEWTH